MNVVVVMGFLEIWCGRFFNVIFVEDRDIFVFIVKSYDLIIYVFVLYWVNDLVG